MPISVELGDPTDPRVVSLLTESDAYYASLYPVDSNHLMDVESLRKPNVSFFVALEQERLHGFGAVVAYQQYGEIKRMYVDRASRGLGIGRKILERIEQKAIEIGLAVLRLETGIRQAEAISLYRSRGYVDIGPFGDYRPDRLSIFMEKRLAI